MRSDYELEPTPGPFAVRQDPEVAALVALDAALVAAILALEAAHPGANRSVLLRSRRRMYQTDLADVVRAQARGLRRLVEHYRYFVSTRPLRLPRSLRRSTS